MSGLGMRRYLSLSTVVFGARLAGASAGFATQVLLARILSAHGLGLYFLATSTAAVLGIVAASGYPNIAVRFVARYRERARLDILAGFVRQAQRDSLKAAFGVALATAVAVLLLPWADAEMRFAVACGALAIPAVAAMRINGSFAVAVRRFQASWLPDLLGRPALFLLAVGTMAGLGMHPSPFLAVGLMTAITGLVAVVQFAWVKRHLPDARPRQDARLGRRWRAASRPLVIVALFTALFADLDLTILGGILPPAELALFGACLKVAFLVDFAILLVQQFAAPDIADGYTRREIGLANRAIAQANSLSLLATLVALVAAVVGGRLVLAAFGPEFAAGHTALIVLVASHVLRAAFGPTLQLLTLIGAERQIAAVFAAATLLLVLANLLLAPQFGVLGAAVAVFATVLFWTSALCVLLYRRTGLRTDVAASITVLRAGAAANPAA